eukprot:m.173652 g.173652  ORF g.173652 m.173652 type:complete len:103 (+) comp18306_c0_seq3:1508-1816(+)
MYRSHMRSNSRTSMNDNCELHRSSSPLPKSLPRLQGIIIQVCSKWYNPTVLIMECLVCLGLIVIAIEITQRCLKRIDSDHGSYSTHENKVVADPSIVGDEDL